MCEGAGWLLSFVSVSGDWYAGHVYFCFLFVGWWIWH